MTTTYSVGEVIYPRVGLPPCAECRDPSDVHRYRVVDDKRMAPNGCDGDMGGGDGGCTCRRYVAPEGTPQAPGTKAPPTKEETWSRYPNDAFELLEPKDSPTVRCGQTLCRAPIWWGLTRANHRRCPFDVRPDGSRTSTSHWRTCRQRPEQPKKPKGEAA